MHRLLLIALFSSGLVVHGQNYYSLIDTSSRWTNQFPNGGDGLIDWVDFKEYYFYGDTIHNDTLYHIVRYNIQYCDYPSTCIETIAKETNYYLWEFKKQVYIKTNTLDNPMQLLYDFNLEVGDTLPLSYINDGENYVTGIDSIWIGDSYRKRFLISGNYDYNDNYAGIIEGIGSTYGLLEKLYEPFEYWPQLICFISDSFTTQFYPPIMNNVLECGFVIVQNNDIVLEKKLQLYPNPNTGSFTLNGSASIHSKFVMLRIYNLSGMEVYKNQFDVSELLYPISIDLPSGNYFLYLRSLEDSMAEIFSTPIIINN